jgi:hypothetical protein
MSKIDNLMLAILEKKASEVKSISESIIKEKVKEVVENSEKEKAGNELFYSEDEDGDDDDDDEDSSITENSSLRKIDKSLDHDWSLDGPDAYSNKAHEKGRVQRFWQRYSDAKQRGESGHKEGKQLKAVEKRLDKTVDRQLSLQKAKDYKNWRKRSQEPKMTGNVK